MINDRRHNRGTIWNLDELTKKFAAHHSKAPINSDTTFDLDQFIYAGYRAFGPPFLESIDGRFACCFWDRERRVVFLARDWIGEVPFHWALDRKGLLIANTVSAIRDASPDSYSYRYIRAFPQSKYLEIDVSGVDANCVAETCRYTSGSLYYNFPADCEAATKIGGRGLKPHAGVIRETLQRSLEQRLKDNPGRVALLLSGGLDSLSIAIMLRVLDIPFVAYTLSVDGEGEDVTMARHFAGLLGVEHRVVVVSRSEVLDAAPLVVDIAETYHLFNFYCSVGMYLIGSRLAQDQVGAVLCGEAVNEAVGDYHNWEVKNEQTGQYEILQRVNYDRMKHSCERLLYVWGQSTDRGKYNRELGTGLAKHAGSRMFKPFLHFNLRLECPYYDRGILAHLISIPALSIEARDGKSGLFLEIFSTDLERLNFPKELIPQCRKVRFQDASEGGSGGLTPVLLSAGYTQERLIALFNERFGSNLDPALEAQRLTAFAAR